MIGKSAAVTGIDPCDLVLIDFIPACARREVIYVHEAWMQVPGTCESFIQNQGHAVIAVTGRVDDFSAKSDAQQEFAALFQLQDEIVVLPDLQVRK